jgi:enoyl-CoA hydratase
MNTPASADASAPVTLTRDGAVGVVTINRPEVLNALDVPTLLVLESVLDRIAADDGIRAVVFTGAGTRAFVAGGDIADLNSRQGLPHYTGFAEVIHRVYRRVETLDKPTIAAINGWALGGGTELALVPGHPACWPKGAKMGLPEITLGLFPGAGGTQRMIRQLAPCVARELMFTGDRIDAAEALRIGLVNRVVPLDQLMPQAMDLARRIAEKSPLVLRLLKRTLAAGADMPLPSALAHEQAMIGLVLDSRDAHEGCSAFPREAPGAFHRRVRRTMAEQILVMPKFGLTMTEGMVSEWLVAPGQTFAAGQPLVAIETDKAVTELEAPAAGVMVSHIAPVGSTLDVGEPIATWTAPVAAGSGAAPAAGRPLISLAAANYARERGIDLAEVTGSGPRGRVEREDVEAYARSRGMPT